MLCNLIARRLNQSFSLAALTKYKNINAGVIARNKSRITKTQSADSNEELSDAPVKFFESEAAGWKAKDSRSGGADEMLWYQPYVISASLAVFLLYFCILREESDIDRRLEGNLFDHVHGLEELQLTMSYKYNKENGIDTRDLEKRLAELGIDAKKIDLTQ